MKPIYICLRSFLLGAIVLLSTAVIGQAAEIDDRIEAAAQDSYVFRTYLKEDSIKPESQDGQVTLTGMVADEKHKSLAQETVANLPGVTGVDNQLKVREDAPDRNTDAWVGIQVKTALLFRRNVSGTGTQVDVNNGVVTLRGEADSLAQKDLATEYAKDVEGVKEVRNEMTVVDPSQRAPEKISEKIDDASITAQVKMALLSHRSTSVLQTKVDTDNGTVVLSGKAKNAAEKDLVTKLVRDINGVESVVNNMVIEGRS